jgi:hypothetical protein
MLPPLATTGPIFPPAGSNHTPPSPLKTHWSPPSATINTNRISEVTEDADAQSFVTAVDVRAGTPAVTTAGASRTSIYTDALEVYQTPADAPSMPVPVPAPVAPVLPAPAPVFVPGHMPRGSQTSGAPSDPFRDPSFLAGARSSEDGGVAWGSTPEPALSLMDYDTDSRSVYARSLMNYDGQSIHYGHARASSLLLGENRRLVAPSSDDDDERHDTDEANDGDDEQATPTQEPPSAINEKDTTPTQEVRASERRMYMVTQPARPPLARVIPMPMEQPTSTWSAGATTPAPGSATIYALTSPELSTTFNGTLPSPANNPTAEELYEAAAAQARLTTTSDAIERRWRFGRWSTASANAQGNARGSLAERLGGRVRAIDPVKFLFFLGFIAGPWCWLIGGWMIRKRLPPPKSMSPILPMWLVSQRREGSEGNTDLSHTAATAGSINYELDPWVKRCRLAAAIGISVMVVALIITCLVLATSR